MAFRYYSLWNNGSSIIKDGTLIGLTDLFAIYQSLGANKSFQKLQQAVSTEFSKRKISEIDMDLFKGVVYSISGIEMTNEDQLRIKSNYQRLRESINRDTLSTIQLTPQFSYFFLPYFAAGFDVSKNTDLLGKGGVNNPRESYEVIKSFHGHSPLEITSYLCFHRQSRQIGFADSVLNELKFSDVKRAMNLLKGLIGNSPLQRASINFYQPSGTMHGIGSIFPDVVMMYATRGILADLMLQLGAHVNSLDSYLKSQSTSNISFSAAGVDGICKIIQETGSRLFGEGWRNLSEKHAVAALEKPHSLEMKVMEIAEYMAKKEVERFMPFYRAPVLLSQDLVEKNIQRATVIAESGNLGIVEETKRALASINETMTIQGKSVQETLFYFSWGFETAIKGGIGIGLDTDHESYQSAAWRLGWDLGINNTDFFRGFPLIYARKSQTSVPSNGLLGISFRQFWR
jgi:hypothetical protein